MDRLGRVRQEARTAHMALMMSWLRHELGKDAPLEPSDILAKSDPEAIQIAAKMALAELPRRWRRALGERGYNYGRGAMAVPRG